MVWSWQHPDWPEFGFRPERLAARETLFQRQAGVIVGTLNHLDASERVQLVIDLMSTEAVKTSEIEGEILDRDSVQSSLRLQFGLESDGRRVRPAEQGIARMFVDLYRRFAEPLDEQTLFTWHRMITAGRTDLEQVGAYRTHVEPMQVVSGAVHASKIHFEAPPSAAMPAEMMRFLAWYNVTAPEGRRSLPALTRAGIAHLYFVCIHPFEDGNGRIGRAIAEKALAQGTGQPALTALSLSIQKHRSAYYERLERANKGLMIDDWLDWFADTVLDAQRYSLAWVTFLVEKARLLDCLRGRLNARQEKVLLRMMREGPDGFRGGLSAGNYRSITGAPPATARRDLADLVALGALTRTGEKRGARYWLTIGSPEDVAAEEEL